MNYNYSLYDIVYNYSLTGGGRVENLLHILPGYSIVLIFPTVVADAELSWLLKSICAEYEYIEPLIILI